MVTTTRYVELVPYGYEARRGAEWLDEHRPGWARVIDVEALDMHNRMLCVLGQLGGDYNEVVGAYEMTPDDILGRGFNLARTDGDNFGPLRAAWVAEIKRRIP